MENTIKKYIVDRLNDISINLVIFGSNKSDLTNKEIDVAIMTDCDDVKFIEILMRVNEIKIDFLSDYNKFLDISLFNAKNFEQCSKFPFNKNVDKEKKLVHDIDLKSFVCEDKITKKLVKQKINELFSITDLLVEDEKYNAAWVYLYYIYYHIFTFYITENDLACNSKIEMVSNIVFNISKISSIEKNNVINFLMCESYMNLFMLNYGYNDNISKDVFKTVYNDCITLVHRLIINN